MKWFMIFLEIPGWLQITIGVTLIAGLLAFLLYLNWDTEAGKLLAIIITSLGFIIGAAWATYTWRKHGTIAWLSRISRIT